MATTVITVEDSVKLAINDLPGGLGAAGNFLSDQLLRGFISDRIISSGTFTLSRHSSGPWFTAGPGYVSKALYFDNASTPFSPEGAETYDIWARGVKVLLKTGSRTSSTVSIDGTMVNFDRIMADVYWYLANYRAQEVSTQVGNASLTPDAAYNALIAQHARWQGVTTSAN